MSERHLHDFDEEPRNDQQADHEKGTERLASITQYPLNQSELPPLPPWYRRWISALWRLFPCTIQWSITGTILVGLLVLLVQWGGDVETGMLAGLIFGAALGLYFDIRSAMDGETFDD